jgi:DNA ligase-1
MTIKPMLAKTQPKKFRPEPGYLQPKLDGVRAIWDGQNLWSRSGKEILGVPQLVAHLREKYPKFPMDGELYTHGKSFQSFLGSIRKTVNIEEDLSVAYHVYDIPVVGMPFAERLSRMRIWIEETDRLKLVETRHVTPAQDLAEHNVFEALGYEGTMYRTASGWYEFGKRSAGLIKIKGFQDAEFLCVGVTEKQTYDKVIVPEGTPGSKPYADGTFYKDANGRGVGTMGALICQVPKTNLRFDVGSGFTDEQRDEFWKNPPLDKLVTVKFFELTDGGVPRFPIFKAIRWEGET